MLIAGVGAISPRVIGLACSHGNYFRSFVSRSDIIIWFISLLILFAFGCFISWMFRETKKWKAFYFGITCPAILFTVSYNVGLPIEPEQKVFLEIVESFQLRGEEPSIINNSGDFEEPYKHEKDWVKVEPDEVIEYSRGAYFPSSPGEIALYLTLSKETMGDHQLAISFSIMNEDSLVKEEKMSLYQIRKDHTIYSNVVKMIFNGIMPYNYHYCVDILTADTLYQVSGDLPLEKDEWISIVGILDFETSKFHIHKVKNLEIHDQLRWVGDLKEKHVNKGNFFIRLLKGILKGF